MSALASAGAHGRSRAGSTDRFGQLGETELDRHFPNAPIGVKI